MKILLYSDETEPVTKLLLEQENLDILPISVSELVLTTPLTRKISSNGDIYQWEYNESLVINRMSHVPEEVILNYPEADQVAIEQDIYAFLSGVLNGKNSSSYPDLFGLGNSIIPLHYQWNKIKQENIDVKVPKFFYGFKDGNPFNYESTKTSTIIYSHPLKVYNWRENLVKQKNVFCFVKPKGIPYQVFMSFDSIVIQALTIETKIETKIEKQLINKVKNIANVFNHKIVEFLFFIDEEDITFGMMSPTLAGYRTLSQFRETLFEGIHND
jgi:hypothetical protein